MLLLQKNYIGQLDDRTLEELFEKHMEPVYKRHCKNVAQIADEIILILQENNVMMPGNFTGEQLHTAFLLHDIGKILTPPNILNKSESLNREEMAVMKTHVIKGLAVLSSDDCFNQLDVPYKHLITEVVCCHHERWDGQGYMIGLSGKDIPFYARVCAVADTYDAITQDRPYQKRRTSREALKIIKHGAGTQFDAVILEILLHDTRWAV